MAATAEVAERELTDAEREAAERSLCIANCLLMAGVTMIVPTRAPMVLGIKRGDTAATARAMGAMSSCAAIFELLFNPVFGRLSDRFGRKPLLLMAPAAIAVLHAAVAALPKSLAMTFCDRVISGGLTYAFIAPVNAGLSDLYSGERLAMAMARRSAYHGFGAALGPLLGARLGGARCFATSALVFLATFAYVLRSLPETLAASARKRFELAACSPLRFLNLFRGRTMSMLATSAGLMSFGDYANVYDINFLYLKTVMGYGTAGIGNFASAVGFTQTLGGKLMTQVIQGAGLKTATALSNAAWLLAQCLLGTSRSARQLVLALVVMTFGHERATPASAYLQTHGQAAGMGKAEIAAAQMNLTALLKVFIPILYGNLFAWATSGKRNVPGMPYFFIGLTTALAQLAFWTVDADKVPAAK